MLYLRGSGHAGGNSTGGTAILPNSYKAGDLLLIHLPINVANANPSTPSGWTRKRYDTNSAKSAALYTKTAVASETAPAFTWTGSAGFDIEMMAWADSDGSTPLYDVSATANGSGTQNSAPTLTPSKGGSLIYEGVHCFGGNGPMWNSGVIRIFPTYGHAGGGYAGCYFGWSTATLAVAGNAVINSNDSNWLFETCAIVPSSSVVPAVILGHGDEVATGSGSSVGAYIGSTGAAQVGDFDIACAVGRGGTVIAPPDVVIRSTALTSGGSGSNSVSVPKSAGTVNGDLIIVSGVVNGAVQIVPPAGWTVLNVADNTNYQAFSRVASGEPSSWTFTAPTSGNGGFVYSVKTLFSPSGGTLSINKYQQSSVGSANHKTTDAVTPTVYPAFILVDWIAFTLSFGPSLPAGLLNLNSDGNGHRIAHTYLAVGTSFTYDSTGGTTFWGSGTYAITSSNGSQWHLAANVVDPTVAIKMTTYWHKIIAADPGSWAFCFADGAVKNNLFMMAVGNLDATTPVETTSATLTGPGLFGANQKFVCSNVNPSSADELLVYFLGKNDTPTLSAGSPLLDVEVTPGGLTNANLINCGYGPIDLCDQSVGFGFTNDSNQPFAWATHTLVLKSANTPSYPTSNLKVSQLSTLIMSSAPLGIADNPQYWSFWNAFNRFIGDPDNKTIKASQLGWRDWGEGPSVIIYPDTSTPWSFWTRSNDIIDNNVTKLSGTGINLGLPTPPPVPDNPQYWAFWSTDPQFKIPEENYRQAADIANQLDFNVTRPAASSFKESLSASISIISSLSKNIRKTLTASISLIATLSKNIKKAAMSVAVTIISTLQKNVRKTLSTIVNLIATIPNRAIGKKMTTAVNLAAVLIKNVRKTLISTVVILTVSILKNIRKTLAVIIILSTTLKKSIGKVFSVSVTLLSYLQKNIRKILSVSVSLLATLQKHIAKILTTSIALLARLDLRSKGNIVLTTSIILTASLQKRIQKTITTTANLIVKLSKRIALSPFRTLVSIAANVVKNIRLYRLSHIITTATITKKIGKVLIFLVHLVPRLSKNVKLNTLALAHVANSAILIKNIGKKLVAIPVALIDSLVRNGTQITLKVTINLVATLGIFPFLHKVLHLLFPLEDELNLVMPVTKHVTLIMPLLPVDESGIIKFIKQPE